MRAFWDPPGPMWETGVQNPIFADRLSRREKEKAWHKQRFSGKTEKVRHKQRFSEIGAPGAQGTDLEQRTPTR